MKQGHWNSVCSIRYLVFIREEPYVLKLYISTGARIKCNAFSKFNTFSVVLAAARPIAVHDNQEKTCKSASGAAGYCFLCADVVLWSQSIGDAL